MANKRPNQEEIVSTLRQFRVLLGFVSQIVLRGFFPFPRIHFAYRFRDGYAKSCVAVEDSDTDMDLRDLPIKVPRHKRLAEQFHAMHLRFNAASAVVSAPSLPQGAAQIP